MAALTKLLPGLTLLLVLSLLTGGYLYYDREASHTAYVTTSSARLSELEQELLDAQRINADLANSLFLEKERNDEFYRQLEDLTGTVSDLDKLSKTDRELLQKYSKVYFLNENYVPDGLTQVDAQWVIPQEKVIELHRKVWPYLENLLEDAADDDGELVVTSGFRSFGTQAGLKSNYTTTFGAGANAFSADQGYSEHQLGTTVDFSTRSLNGSLLNFATTNEYQWLLKNAHKYGFVLSYPEGNSYYIFEPWHWRFVGRELAGDLYDDEKHFYDLDQREIDQYLIDIFD